jgi:hypothetical protein
MGMSLGWTRIGKAAWAHALRRRCRLSILLLGAAAASACGDLTVPVLEFIPSTSRVNAATPSDGATKSDGATQSDAATPLDGAASFRLRYEAEAVPPNVLTYSATADLTCFGSNLTCPTDGVEEGANCCSGGGVITEIIGRAPCSGPPGSDAGYTDCQDTGAGVEFDDVTVPADGTYDVTWWYHCGEANTYGDTMCGGLHYAVGTGCRPQLIDVNGVPMSATVDAQMALIYQFPCYVSAWSVVHGATTALPLKSGLNIIYFHAPHATNLDAADVDAIDVQPLGQGVEPRVTPVVSGY